MNSVLTTATACDGATARAALTPLEMLRCEGLPGPRRQQDFRAGRLAAKRAATVALGPRSHRRIQIATEPGGCPSLQLLEPSGRIARAPATLSISHRDGRAVAVIAPAALRVGVDLEREGAIPHAMLPYFLARNELDLAAGIDATVLWSIKEAAWKALGLGRSVPLKRLRLDCDAHGGLRGVRLSGLFLPIHVRLTRPWPGYHQVVVWMTGGAA